MQNEVQTSIKIAIKAKECADIQKKAKLKLGICLHKRMSREKPFQCSKCVFSDDESGNLGVTKTFPCSARSDYSPWKSSTMSLHFYEEKSRKTLVTILWIMVQNKPSNSYGTADYTAMVTHEKYS